MVENGKGRFLPILSSVLAQEILSRGYDARTLQRVYTNRPASDVGLFGRLADRMVLDLPVHQALRERLDTAAGEIAAAASVAVRGGASEFRVLCAPCGLGSEMLAAADRLRALRPEVLERTRFTGIDPDADGHLLPEATRRARAAGIEARFIREDLRRHREVDAAVAKDGPYHFVSFLGVSQDHSVEQLRQFVRYFARVLAPGGTLLIDRWEGSGDSSVAKGLGIEVMRHQPRLFHEMLREAGLEVEREHASGEGGCVLVVARKPAA
jgi:SAM-dependent methyltransferase